ncbi:DUF86 domain-containing protein [Candidatus Woesearchaeota archaeon]|nr:DUF86 domain-containing protein [Candidatus Woesearchaeota archaeon]
MNKKIRKELVRSKISKILDTLEFIESNFPEHFEEFKHSRILRDAIYKEIEFCIELVLDVLSIINKDLKLGIPEAEDDMINNLEKNRVLSRKTMSLLREIKKFRNILVHRYGEINDEQAYETIKDGLDDFSNITEEIERFLKKN